jgi:hypothetical protein
VEPGEVLAWIVLGPPLLLLWGLAALLSQGPPSAPAPQRTYYSNVEEWELVRDPETGRLRGIKVIREAKVG